MILHLSARGLRTRIVLTLGGILLLFAVAASTLLILENRASEMRALEENGRLFARYATDRLYENYASYYIYGSAEGQRRFAELTEDMLAANPAVFAVRLMDPSGEALYDSLARDLSGIEADPALRELIRALARKPQRPDAPAVTRRSSRGGEDVLQIVRPYSPGGVVLAVAAYDLSMTSIRKHVLAASAAVLGGIALFFILLWAALSWIVTRAVLRPVTVLSAAAQALGHGYLDVRVDMNGGSEEMNVLARSFNTMARDLHGIVTKLAGLGREVASASTSIGERTREVAEGTAEQASESRITGSAMERMFDAAKAAALRARQVSDLTESVKGSFGEMTVTTDQIARSTDALGAYVDRTHDSIMEINSSVGEVSRSAESLHSLSNDAAHAIADLHESIHKVREQADRSRAHSQSAHEQAAALGSATVEQAVAGIDRLREIVNRAVGIIERLSQRSEEVGRIAVLIDEVTDRTNLLGINASIMAAQAGEHGAGFAVVAEEIKSLSIQIASSTRDITRVLTSMREEAGAAVRVIREGSTSAAESVRLSEDVRVALSKIVEHSAETGRALAGIAGATEKQGDGTRQLTELAERVAAMARETAEATRSQKGFSSQIVDATEGMRTLAEQVRRSTQEHSKNARQVAEAMQDLGSGVEAIARAVQHQLEKAEPVRDSLALIARQAEANRSRSAAMAGTAGSLAQRAQSLRAELARFRYRGGAVADRPPHHPPAPPRRAGVEPEGTHDSPDTDGVASATPPQPTESPSARPS